MLEVGPAMPSVVALVLAASLAGCVSQDSELSPTEGAGNGPAGLAIGWQPHAVVALFDTGINPYHPAFRADGIAEPSTWIPDLPPYETITLSFDLPYEEAFQKDRLAELQRDRLYWFKNTRILAYSHDEYDDAYQYPVIDEHGHGTGLASIVLRTNPNAMVLAVESTGDNHDTLPWAADQAWIDVISISVAAVANAPIEFVFGDLGRSQALRNAKESGKIVIAGSGNEVVPPHTGTYQGPPWSISVGGVVESTHGESVLAGRTPDFVSEFVGHLAAKETTTDDYWNASGTSFSTPLVAGVISRAIYEVRSAWNYGGNIVDGALAVGPDGQRLTNTDVRLALNHTAVYWDTTSYSTPQDPTSCPTCTVARASVPIAPEVSGTPIGPWIQMGWGFVDESIVDDLVSVLLGSAPLPEKPAGAVEFMEAVYEARQTYWSLPRPPRPPT